MKKSIIISLCILLLIAAVATVIIVMGTLNDDDDDYDNDRRRPSSESSSAESTPLETPPAPCEHTYGELTLEKEPECEIRGYKSAECSKCGDKITETVLPKGHLFENGFCSICQTKDTYSKGLKFYSNGDGTCSVKGMGSCYDSDVRIPYRSPEGDLVTEISMNAFLNCSSLSSVVMPNSITGIGDTAFYYCSNLTSVTLSDNLTAIGIYAFNYCISLPSITLPDSITVIGNGAFNTCNNLTNINLPENIEYLGDFAFGSCERLTSITLPSKITFIGSGLFYNCFELTEIIIPEGVTRINSEAFWGCKNLTSVVIPDSVIQIGTQIFKDCDNLNLNQYDNALYLGNKSDPYMILIKATNDNITSCKIHSSTRFIHDNAFYNCRITSISIPEGLKSIGKTIFSSYASLTELNIPSSVTSFGVTSFYEDTELAICNKYDNALYLGNASNPYMVLIKPISQSITSCKIHPDTKIIAGSAFLGCNSLAEITIPNGVITIGEDAFWGCRLLTDIEIPDSVTFIGKSAFWECENLENVILGSGVEMISSSAFFSGYKLSSVVFKNTDGWVVRSTNAEVDVTDPIQNAKNIIYKYGPYDLVRK